jgi:hypothetical protein
MLQKYRFPEKNQKGNPGLAERILLNKIDVAFLKTM